MPASPNRSQVHVNKPLTNVSVAFIQDRANFSATRLFPMVRVEHRSDLYYTYDRDAWFRSDVKPRAPGSESAGVDYKVSTASYACEVYAGHHDISDQERANADPALDMDIDTTELLTQQYLLGQEIEFKNRFLQTGIWTGAADFTPATKWDQPTGDPIKDMRGLISSVHSKTGFRPNVLGIGQSSWNAVVDNPKVLERIQFSERAIVTEDLVAAALGLDRVVVMAAVQNSAVEGAAPSYGFVNGDVGLLAYAPSAPGLRRPSAGYTFGWRNYTGASDIGVQVKSFRIEPKECDRIEVSGAYQMKVVASDLGAFFSGTLTP